MNIIMQYIRRSSMSYDDTLQDNQVQSAENGDLTAKEFVASYARQMFDSFMDKNFDSEQQKEINAQITQALQANNGTCTIRWQGADKRDNADITYQNGKLTRFTMHNYTETVAGIATESRNKINYKEKDKVVLVKIKNENKQGSDRSAQKIKITARDNKFDAKTTNKQSTAGQIGLSLNAKMQKDSQRIKSERAGSSKEKITRTTVDAYVGLQTSLEIVGDSQTNHYDKDGNLYRKSTNYNKLEVGGLGGKLEHRDSNTTFYADQDNTHRSHNIEVGAGLAGVGIKAGTTNRSTDKDGNIKSSTTLGVEAQTGFGHIAGGFDYEHQKDGNELKAQMKLDFNSAQRRMEATAAYLSKYGTKETAVDFKAAGNKTGVEAVLHTHGTEYNPDGTVLDHKESNSYIGAFPTNLSMVGYNKVSHNEHRVKRTAFARVYALLPQAGFTQTEENSEDKTTPDNNAKVADTEKNIAKNLSELRNNRER